MEQETKENRKDNTLLYVNNLNAHFYMEDKVIKAADGVNFNIQKNEVLEMVCGLSFHVGTININ